MAAKPRDPALLLATLKAVEEHGSIKGAARALGIPYPTLQHRFEAAKTWQANATPDFEMPDLPAEDVPIEELIARRARQFDQKRKAKEARKLISVRVNMEGPIGLALAGDPHLDDDGTDIHLVQRDLGLVKKTEGLFAGCIGDYNNNWDGRLMKLWAEQSTSAAEAWRLVEWYIRAIPWLFLIRGNHDAWSQSRDPIQRIAGELGILYENQARLALELPNGRSVRLNARHDFRGHSMWNPAHGVGKAVHMGWRDHLAVCGHLHISGYMQLRDPSTRLISHALRVGSYKIYDRYGEALGLPDQTVMICPVAIIDPRFSDDDPRFISVISDTEEGADFLTWKRKKWAKGGRAA